MWGLREPLAGERLDSCTGKEAMRFNDDNGRIRGEYPVICSAGQARLMIGMPEKYQDDLQNHPGLTGLAPRTYRA